MMKQQISKPRPLSPQSVTAGIQRNSMKGPEMHLAKHVRFAAKVEIKVFDRIDPALKADLYYSREEMYCIQKRLRMAIALRRQLIESKELQEKVKEGKVHIDYLKDKSEANERKRLLDNNQSIGGPALATKRRRIQ